MRHIYSLDRRRDFLRMIYPMIVSLDWKLKIIYSSLTNVSSAQSLVPWTERSTLSPFTKDDHGLVTPSDLLSFWNALNGGSSLETEPA